MTRVDATLRAAGRHMVVTGGSGPGDQRQQALDGIDFLLGRDCDGLIVASHHLRDADLQVLRQRQPCLVVVNRQVPRMASHCFVTDHIEGGRLAARALLSKGHRDIAVLSGPHDAPDNEQRMAGFLAELARHGLQPVLRFEGDFTYTSGAAVAGPLMAAIDRRVPAAQRCSAIFCANDLMALGLSSCLTQAGWRLPEELSLLGYDDADVAPYATPPLSTIHAPIAEAAVAACEQLLRLCAGPAQPAPQRRFDCAVIWRESVGPGPHAALGPVPRAAAPAPAAAHRRLGSTTQY
jgi:LacI family transcriptional regulator